MKRLIGTVAALACAWCVAQEAAPAMPPEEEAPFKIVIEEVPEEEAAQPAAPAPVEAPALATPQAPESQPASATPATPAQPAAAAPVEASATPAPVAEEVDPRPNCGHVLTPPKGFVTTSRAA